MSQADLRPIAEIRLNALGRSRPIAGSRSRRLLGQHVYLPLGSTAHKQGRVARTNAIGGNVTFAGSLGTQAVKIFDLVAAGTGLRDHTARAAGYDPVTR